MSWMQRRYIATNPAVRCEWENANLNVRRGLTGNAFYVRFVFSASLQKFNILTWHHMPSTLADLYFSRSRLMMHFLYFSIFFADLFLASGYFNDSDNTIVKIYIHISDILLLFPNITWDIKICEKWYFNLN